MKVDKLDEIIEMINTLSDKFYKLKNNIFSPYGLSAIQASIILDIYHNPNETKITDICKRLNKSTNSISPLVNRLVEKDFLEKKHDEKDKRIFTVCLTEKSKKITNDIQIDVTDYTLPLKEELSDEQLDTIKKSLEILLKAVF